MTVGVIQPAYKVEVLRTKQAGVADAGTPTWVAQDWTVGGGYLDITNNGPISYGVDFNAGIHITGRGKTEPLGSVGPGQLVVNMRDPTNNLIGLLSDSIAIRVTATYATVWHNLGLFWINDVVRDPTRSGRVVISAVDMLADLALVPTPASLPPTVLTTGAAIADVLNRVPWVYQRLATGANFYNQSVQAIPAGASALDAIGGFVAPTLGTFFIAADGYAVFLARGSQNAGGVKAVITNVMTRVPREIDRRKVFNDATATRTRPLDSTFQPLPQHAINTTSINKRRRRKWSLESPYFVSDSDAAAVASTIVATYAVPQVRVRQVDLENRDVTLLTAMLTVDVGDRVTIAEAQDGSSGDYVVWGVSHAITRQRHRTTWTMAPPGL